METNLDNNYVFRAIELYPYELEKAVEALNYALSYDADNVKALCLMARVYSEQLGDYEAAKEYYVRALASSMDIPNVYPEYIELLINNEDFDEAQKLIDYAIHVKGIDKANIFLNQAYLFEAKQLYAQAESALKEAKMYALNNDFIEYVDGALSRVVKKRKTMHNEKLKKEEEPTKVEKSAQKSWLVNRLNNLL